MKLVIAQMKHETNTYSPVPTPLARLAHGSATPPEGADAIAAYRGTGSAIGAFIELVESAGAEFVVPIAASAWPSGPVDDRAFEAIGLKGEPRTVRGTVRLICDGRYRNRGPMARGETNDMGPTAVLDTGRVKIVVISNHVEPHDLAAFTTVGIAPETQRFVMLKSRIHWRAGLKPLAHAVVECAGTGVCTSDYATLAFKNVRRPIYPVDAM